MATTDEKLFSRIHALAVGQLESTLSPGDELELRSLLLESSAARQMYCQYVQETACLRWLCLEQIPAEDQQATPAERILGHGTMQRRILTAGFFGALACALAAVSLGWLSFWKSDSAVNSASGLNVAKVAGGTRPQATAPEVAASRPPVATITGLRSVLWTHADGAGSLLSRCNVGERLQINEGAVELTFDAGVQLTVFGPADFMITSPTSIRCARGRVTTLVNDRGKGFTIETPKAKVVDLGTQFGLDISEEGETQVIVFQGSVDLTYNPLDPAGNAPTRRLERGEALLVKNSGELQRLVSVERNQFLTGVDGIRRQSGRPVIMDVQDNIRKAESLMSYQIVHAGLEEDTLCFVDRDHEWNGMDRNGLPDFLRDADYIMPFNDDKFVRDLEITVQIARPANLYVFLDNNMKVPRWLRKNFEDTGVDIGLDGAETEWHPADSLAIGAGRSVDFPFSVWRREVRRPGPITLGGLEPPRIRSRGFNMYGIAAVATQ